MPLQTDLSTFTDCIRQNVLIAPDYTITNTFDLILQGRIDDATIKAAISEYQEVVEPDYEDLIIANLGEVDEDGERSRGFFSDIIDKAASKVRAIYDNIKMRFFTKPEIVRVSDTTLGDIMDSLESNRLEVITKLADDRIAGNTNTKDWANSTIAELKNLHTQAFTLGRGGLNNLTIFDKSHLENIISQELTYFAKMSSELSTGKLSAAQLKSRLAAYTDKARGLYEEGRFRTAIANNYTVERRVRRAIESCQPCLDYAARGWVIIGSLPNPTFECDCKSRCKCVKEYSKDTSLLN